MRRRRNLEVFSLSFLDCICCGFGAIVLLLVLSKIYEPVVLEQSLEDLEGVIAKLEEELFELRGETKIITRKLTSKEEQLSEVEERIARLQGDLSEILGRYDASKDDAAVQNIIEGQLAEARQDLTEEMKRLFGENYERKREDHTIGGIPVDSEYVIFVVDTSGSMQRFNWDLVQRKVAETLDIYPRVKGIQVMNDMGEYMFRTYANKWIPDSPARRRAILKRLRSWQPFSNSSPVEGITRAIRSFYAPDRKISIYVFGDEFSGPSIQDAVSAVDAVNRETESGDRMVRIHGVGFPLPSFPGQGVPTTGVRFATLMRVLCDRNGGTFVGIGRSS
jgi:ribosomal protein L29